MQNDSRRTFLKNAGTALAAGSLLNLNASAYGANEKVVLALIGGNHQGRLDAINAIRDGAEIKTFCDLDDAVLGKSAPIWPKPREGLRAPKKTSAACWMTRTSMA